MLFCQRRGHTGSAALGLYFLVFIPKNEDLASVLNPDLFYSAIFHIFVCWSYILLGRPVRMYMAWRRRIGIIIFQDGPIEFESICFATAEIQIHFSCTEALGCFVQLFDIWVSNPIPTVVFLLWQYLTQISGVSFFLLLDSLILYLYAFHVNFGSDIAHIFLQLILIAHNGFEPLPIYRLMKFVFRLYQFYFVAQRIYLLIFQICIKADLNLNILFLVVFADQLTGLLSGVLEIDICEFWWLFAFGSAWKCLVGCAFEVSVIKAKPYFF